MQYSRIGIIVTSYLQQAQQLEEKIQFDFFYGLVRFFVLQKGNVLVVMRSEYINVTLHHQLVLHIYYLIHYTTVERHS